MTSQLAPPATAQRRLIGATVFLVGVVIAAYWSTLLGLAGMWWSDPDYTHGFLVPVFAGILLWVRRDLAPARPDGSWWGVPLLVGAVVMRAAGAYYYFGTLEPLSLLPCLAGVALLTGGWKALHWSWPSIVFLGFMLRLPGFLGGMLSQPLQRIGTIASTYCIQILGIPAVARGNVITLPARELGVVEACSGLRMLMLFVTVCVGAAFLSRRSLFERALMVVSAVPIAIAANVLRIVLTAVLSETVSHEAADKLFHDFAGWLMMPTAVVLLWLELAILSRLAVDPYAKGPLVPAGLSLAASSPRDGRGGQSPATSRRRAEARARRDESPPAG